MEISAASHDVLFEGTNKVIDLPVLQAKNALTRRWRYERMRESHLGEVYR
jgi:hypothetical protein